MNNKYPKGAEWRKWDLHVHTPNSVYQKYGSSNDTWEKYISDLEGLSSEFAVVGINDYLFLDGYEKLAQEQKTNGRVSNLTLLPVVEFRIEKFAGVDFGSLKRINLHVIFSNELTVETIRSQFLNTLEQSYLLEDGSAWSRAITVNSVAELGAQIKASAPEGKRPKGNDLTVGFNNLNVKEDQILKALDKDCFKGKYLIAVGKTEWADLKWTDASIATKKSTINSADIVFTAADTVQDFEKSKAQLVEQNVNSLLLDCSDAHYFSNSDDKDRIGNSLTWLKADPTFEGLKQVIIEPEERIFIGDIPPILERITTNRTKYIQELSITQVDEYDSRHGAWFKDISIPLNGELVAIIGNKGSGKSAIADIIALCSNYPQETDFSFLTTDKFKKKKLAASFNASMKWESGKVSPINLNDQSADADLLHVKYLPQGQFERLTNEIQTAEEFQQEIESVVFSHIPDSEKLGTSSFNQLIKKTSASVNLEIDGYKKEIRETNRKIIALERRSTSSYRTEFENKLNAKQEEISALIEPTAVSNPSEAPGKQQLNEAVNKTINELNGQIQKIQIATNETNTKKKTALESLQKLKTIRSDIQQKKTEIGKFMFEKAAELSEFDIDVGKLISIETNFTDIDALILANKGSLQNVKELLGEVPTTTTITPLADQLKEKQALLKIEKSKLDSEQQLYQKYLADKANWLKAKEAIIGATDKFDTLKFYEHQLIYLDQHLSNELDSQYEDRRGITRSIFDKKQDIISIYKDARNRLNKIIDENQNTLKDYKIKVDASLVKQSDFNARFLGYILQNKAGTFHSKDGGEAQLIRLLTDIDFDKKEDVISLLDSLIAALHADDRTGQKDASRSVTEQVKDVEGLYEYLFSLEFLDKNYQLKQGDKNLEQLSPGERGALLLVFYLLLDNNDMPLLIDQPEDNLDNHSIATILVPFIRVAKKKRQIIMVTHNPNLAVVSDAEQVIYVNLDKDNNYTFSTTSGSIENQKVNKKIVDVLEGAMPAFNTRKRKYYE